MRDEERDNQIGDEERGRAVRFVRGRLFENGEQRQQNKNWARINDLPFEMVTVRLMGAHARGRVSYAFSLTSRAKFAVRQFPGRNGGKLAVKARIPLEKGKAQRSPPNCFQNALSDVGILLPWENGSWR